MKSALATACLLLQLLAACSRPPVVEPRQETASGPAGQAAPAVEEAGALPPDTILVADAGPLVGTWYEWAPAGDPHRGDIILAIDRQRMVATSGCATMAWSYRVADGRIAIERAPVASCARGLTPREERFARVLDAATVAFHRGGRGLVLEGEAGRLVLFDRPGPAAAGNSGP